MYKKVVFKNYFKPEHADNPTVMDHVVAETIVLRSIIKSFSYSGEKALDYHADNLANLHYFQSFLGDCTVDPTTPYRFQRIVYPETVYRQKEYGYTRGCSVSRYLQSYYEYTDRSDFDHITEDNLYFLQTNQPYAWFSNPSAIKCLKSILQAYCWCCQ